MCELRWTSHKGDEWWCGDASAGYGAGAFTIGSFGSFSRPERAYELIRDARLAFRDAMLYVYLDLDNETRPILSELSRLKKIVWSEIEISDRTRMARIDAIQSGS